MPLTDPNLVEHYKEFLDAVCECPPIALRTAVAHLYDTRDVELLGAIMDIHYGTATYGMLATLLVESATIRDPSVTGTIALVLSTQTDRQHN